MNREIEWFCYHTVEEGLLTVEQCRAVADAIEEAEDVAAELDTFAQTIVDNELCTDIERLEQLMHQAQEAAESMEYPPRCVISGRSDDQNADTAEDSGRGAPPSAVDVDSDTVASHEKRGQEPVSQSPAASGTETPAVSALQGWPDFTRAADMEFSEARTFMNELLAAGRTAGCSDLHISVGAQPFVRYKTRIHKLSDQKVITGDVAEKLNLSILTDSQREAFEQSGDMDLCYATADGERYRTNLHRQRLGAAGSYRIIDKEIATLSELGFPRTDVLEKLTTYHQGLILITGPAGCGKSTTMNAFVDMINRSRHEHIVTVEDPVEFVHMPKKCNITQREVGSNTESFSKALRASLREDPDIIAIGELRDLETIEMAIRASETGHLVLGTLHTLNAASTMDRLLDVFPPEQQGQIRSMVSENLKGVICQQLVLDKDETGIVLASEIMLGTLAIANIIREGETFKLPSTIQTSYNVGMRTIEQSIFELYMQDKLTYDQAMARIEADDLIRKMQTNEAKRAAEKSAAGGKKKKGWFK